MPEISIIVPVYNVEVFLRQCLDSLLAQTFRDFELICINDGSTDSSLDILEEYAAADGRIRLFSKENEGYGKTMNLGLSEARAPYVGIVESDDFVKKEMFGTLYGAIRENRADVVKCNFYKYTAGSGEGNGPSPEYPDWVYGKVVEPIGCPELYLANSSIWAALYDRRFLEENGIRFNETPGGSFQDISFQFRVLSSARRMTVIQDALLYYRTDNMMSSVHSPYKIYCICDEMHAIEDYIREQDGERQEILWPRLARRKYYDYRWNWRRLPMAFQYAFYEKMVAELRADRDSGKFQGAAWENPEDEADMERMLAAPLAYFLEKTGGFRDTRTDLVTTRNSDLARLGFFSLAASAEGIVVYGAGKVGRHVASRLREYGIPEGRLLFAVTDGREAGGTVDGIPVRQVDGAIREYPGWLFLVAVKGEPRAVMLNRLKFLGCGNILLADDAVLSYLEHAPER